MIIAKKRLVSSSTKWKNTIAVLQKTFIRSSQVTFAYEPKGKQQSTVSNPSKVVRKINISKQMVACFFGKTGHVATVPLEQSRTVHAEWYNSICLPKVLLEIRKTNKR